MEKRHIGRGVAGFFTTLLLFQSVVVFIVTGTFRLSVFRGNTVRDLLQNTKFYDMESELIVDAMYSGGQNKKISEQAIRDIMSEQFVKKVTESVLKSVEAGEEVDLTDLRGDLTDYSKQVSELLLDNIIAETEEKHIVLNAGSIRNLEEVKAFNQEYNVEISDLIIGTMQFTFHTTELELTDDNKEKFKTSTTTVINRAMEPVVNNLFDQHIGQLNQKINKGIEDANQKYEIKKILSKFQKSTHMLNMTMEISLIGSILLALLDLLIYRKDIYRGFRHGGSAFISAAMIGFLMGITVFAGKNVFLKDIAASADGKEMIVKTATQFIEYNANAILVTSSVIAGIILVIGILFKITSAIIKKNQTVKKIL